jgi:thioredoxin
MMFKKIMLLPVLIILLAIQSCAIGQSKTANTTVLSGLTKAKYDALLKTDKIVLVDFYADWCGPCKKMKPSIEEIAVEMKDKVVVVRIDADQNPDICKELSVESLPTLFVYKKGIMMWQNVGYVEKEEIVKYLK